jgi:hypothetical protein
MKTFLTIIVSLFALHQGLAQVEVYSTDSLRVEDPKGEWVVDTSSSNSSLSDSGKMKLIFWVHGISGSQKSWGHVQSATDNQVGHSIPGYPARNSEGLALSYSGYEHLKIFQLGGFVNNNVMETWRRAVPRRDTLSINENIVIAHSQGGIVSRAICYLNIVDPSHYPTQFGLVATFGTPHKGADIINATIAGGPVQTWIDEGCKAIAPAEIQTFINTKWYLDLVISPSIINGFSSQACNGLNSLALSALVNSLSKPVGADYAIGAPNLALLDSAAQLDSLNVITFYGVEEEPVFWRVVHSLSYTQDSSLSGSILNNYPFGLTDDQELPDFVNNKINDYRLKELNQRELANGYMNHARKLGFFIWSTWSAPTSTALLRAFFINKALAAQQKEEIYRVGGNWLALSNMSWKRFIGARRDTTYQDGYFCDCLIDSGGTAGYNIIQRHVQNAADCSHPLAINCTLSPNVIHTIKEEQSDGVVTVSSQRGYPGKVLNARMVDTNHMQMRNCEETKKHLVALFNGKYHKQFKITQK